MHRIAIGNLHVVRMTRAWLIFGNTHSYMVNVFDSIRAYRRAPILRQANVFVALAAC